MAVPTVLTSASGGAPAISGQTGKLYDVVKWALPQLRWSIEFDEGTSKIAISNSAVSGTGDVLRFDDDHANHDGADARTCNVKSYSSMSDIDTGADEVGAADWFITKSTVADSSTRPWAIIGDETAFALLIDHGDNGFYSEYYFGDIAPDKPGDTGAFLTQSAGVASPISTTTVAPFNDYGLEGLYSELRFNLAVDQVGINCKYPEYTVSGNNLAISGPPGRFGSYPEPASGGMRVQDVSLIEIDNDTCIRGRLKGALQILNNVSGQFSNGQTILNQATPRGLADCMVFNRRSRLTNNSDDGVVMYDISTDWNNW